MEKKLYVGNLPYSITSEALSTKFQEFGNVVSARIITDRETGRSKGFGFVEMETEEAAGAAIEALNQQEFEGRRMIVNEARPQAPRAPRNFNR